MPTTITRLYDTRGHAEDAVRALKDAGIGDGDSLHALGLTSMTTVSLMLALEDAFNVEFPDALLSAQTFGSVASIAAALQSIQAHPQ